MDVRILQAPVPESLDAADSWALRAIAALDEEVATHTWGHPDLAESLTALWAWARNDRYGRNVHLVAVPASAQSPGPEDVLGWASLHFHPDNNSHLLDVSVAVPPGLRRRHVGTALARHAEELARADGRGTVQSWSDHAVEPPEPGPDGPPVLRPPTGSGRIPDDAASRFAVGLGFALEQGERHSVLDLPADAARLDRLDSEARAVAGPDHRVVTWVDEAPEQYLDHTALLHTRMSTDPPLAGLDYREDVWDGARVRDWEATHAEAGHRLLVAAAEHVPTGELAAFTVLVVRPGSDGKPDAVFQDATLVRREHRGRRLGMLVKVANVRAVQAAFPGARRVHTWNAEENAHMLAINVALGFRPDGISAAWQKVLA